MAFSTRGREKQVRLAVFDNEPLARLAEQRLREAGIPCITRSLRGGPGIWGSAYNLPHDLYIYESDEMRARELLELTPQEPGAREARSGSNQNRSMVLMGAVLVALLLAIVIVLFNSSG